MVLILLVLTIGSDQEGDDFNGSCVEADDYMAFKSLTLTTRLSAIYIALLLNCTVQLVGRCRRSRSHMLWSHVVVA